MQAQSVEKLCLFEGQDVEELSLAVCPLESHGFPTRP